MLFPFGRHALRAPRAAPEPSRKMHGLEKLIENACNRLPRPRLAGAARRAAPAHAHRLTIEPLRALIAAAAAAASAAAAADAGGCRSAFNRWEAIIIL